MNPVGKASGADLFSTVRGASRAVTQAYDDAIRSYGLRATQFGVLNAIQRLGRGTVQEVASAAFLDNTTATRALQVLKTGGYISVVEGADRRQRIVTLSSEGQRIIKRATPSWNEVNDQLTRDFGQDRLPVLIAGLLSLTDVARTNP